MQFALPMPPKSLHPVVRVLLALVGAAALALLIVFGALALLVLLSVGVVALIAGRWRQAHSSVTLRKAAHGDQCDPDILEGEFVVLDKHAQERR